MTMHYDVIIIGTGAGGGTLAWKLAPTGKKILILERGGFVPREKDNWNSRAVVTACFRKLAALHATSATSSSTKTVVLLTSKLSTTRRTASLITFFPLRHLLSTPWMTAAASPLSNSQSFSRSW